MSSPTIIDLEAIENLRALDGDGSDGFLREIIGIYLEDVPLRFSEIRAAMASGDRALLTRSAHTVKGSSANVGAAEVRAIAEQLEHRSKTADLDTLGDAADELEAAFARAKTALSTYLSPA